MHRPPHPRTALPRWGEGSRGRSILTSSGSRANSDLGDSEHENAAVEIQPDIVPVELHQATVSEVVRLLYSGRHLQGKAKRGCGTRGQTEPKKRRLRQARETRIHIQQKCADRRL